MGVGMKAITKRQRALQVGYLCLVEDGSERRGARVSDEVPLETASEGWEGDGERVSVSTGADTKQILYTSANSSAGRPTRATSESSCP